ncbi:MAG: phosphate signaling complex protein PhoU [Candidatus Methanomethylophilaceae archaeon]
MMNKFHQDLDELTEETIEMGELVVKMLDWSVKALREGDMQAADWVLQQEKEVQRMDSLIEDEAMRLMALFQPMAKDMRRLATILKMITYMERVGKYSFNIATAARSLEESEVCCAMRSLPEMADIVVPMVRDAVRSFKEQDISLVADLAERDDRLDAIREKVIAESLQFMKDNPERIPPCVYYITISRYLERCGDHSCKMAEKVVYMVSGRRIQIK